MGGMGGFGGNQGPQMGGFGGGMDSGINTYPGPQQSQRQMGDAQPQNQFSGMNPMQGARMMMQRFGQGGMRPAGMQEALQRGETGLSAMQQGGQGIQGLMGGMQGQMPQQMQTQGGMQGQAFGALSQPGMGTPLSSLRMAEGFNPQEGIQRQQMQQQQMQQSGGQAMMDYQRQQAMQQAMHMQQAGMGGFGGQGSLQQMGGSGGQGIPEYARPYFNRLQGMY
jgi:hypothetical protein